MKVFKTLSPQKWDLLVALIFSLLIFIAFNLLDAFESIYTFTRQHENWEVDEVILLLLSFPLPLAWFSYRRLSMEKKLMERQFTLQQSLAQSSKLEAMGTLAGGIAHELNNQLQPVIAMSEMIKNSLDDSDANRRKIELVLKGAMNAKQTVAKIKNFSHLGNESQNVCNISEAVGEIQILIDATLSSNICYSAVIAPNLGNVTISLNTLQGILINLINNAADSIGDKIGEIHLSLDKIDDNYETQGLDLEQGNYARIVVKDTGHGMSHEVKKRVFDPFYTTKEVGSGVGLGLSLVYTGINQAGGFIFVESVEGKGSTFTIVLPLID